MDPLAHTLVGATLAETGLRRTTRLATPALLIGANLPDVDAVTSFVDADLMYGFRRGWTHGVLGMALWPWLLTGLLLLYARLRPLSGADPPLRPKRLLAIAHLAVLSHPLLDWLNNYGIRLLMPLDATWYYGDAIFIVDPWMWLSMASAVVLARSDGPLAASGWVLLATATGALVLGSDMVPFPAKLLWCVGTAAIVAARLSRGGRRRARRLARGALLGLGVYIAASLAGTVLARVQVRNWLEQAGHVPERIVAGPVAANPFQRDVIALSAGNHYIGPEVRSGFRLAPDGARASRNPAPPAVWPSTFFCSTYNNPARSSGLLYYHFVRVDWLSDTPIRTSQPPLAVNDGPLPRAALAAPELSGFAHWLRLPAFEIVPRGDGTRVRIRDVRYRGMGASIGNAHVDFDHAGNRTAVALGR